MTAKKIYLHIGFGKTGTSAVQEFFFHNQECFTRQGLGYPSVGLTPWAHHGLALFQQEDMPPGVSGLYRDLVSEIDGSPASKFLISSEQFCFLKPPYIARVKQHLSTFDIKIIFYVRNQVRLVESTYLEWQKAGLDYKNSIADFFRAMHKGFDFELRIASWIQEFGLDNTIVRVYDRRVIGEDTSADMMRLLGLAPTPDIMHMNLRSNPSLLPDFSRLVSLMDESGIQRDSRPKIIQELLGQSEKFKAHANQSLVTEDLKREILDCYRDSNRRFASTHLDENDASIFLAD